MTLLVGLDVGTTSIKAVAYEPDGRAVARATAPTPAHHPRPGWAFYHPDELWERCAGALRAMLGRVDDPRRVAGVAVASIGETVVPLDRGGRPTADAIAWFDTRTRPQAAWLDRVVGRDRLFASTGLSLQPIFSLNKLLWLREHDPDAWARTVRWLLVADYVAFRLGGAPATDFSLASRTLMLDLHRLRWDEEVLAAVGIDPGVLAPLVPGGTLLGKVSAAAARETGLPETAIVAAGGHDHVCGALAAGVTEPGQMLNSLGTAEALFLPTERPLADPGAGRQGYTQGAHVVGGRTYAFAGQYTCGASVAWLRGVLGGVGDEELGFDALTAEAAQVPVGSLGVAFLPHLRLANPPYDDPRSRGAFVGLSTDATRGVLARAVLEGLAMETRGSYDGLLAYPEVVPAAEVIAIGGGTRNGLLMAIKAAVMDLPHHVVEAEEATALGAATLAGLAAGVYPDVAGAVAALRHDRTPVLPDRSQVGPYAELYDRVYRRLYPALAPLSHALVDLQAGRP